MKSLSALYNDYHHSCHEVQGLAVTHFRIVHCEGLQDAAQPDLTFPAAAEVCMLWKSSDTKSN
jgi:hypothetical protein